MNITYVGSDEQEKLQLLDRVFQAFSKDDLVQILGQDLVVAKLKGVPERTGILQGLVMDNQMHDNNLTKLQNECLQLRNDIMMLKTDLTTLVKIIDERLMRVPNSMTATEYNNMKGKHGIY